jgi:hypothetical protein
MDVTALGPLASRYIDVSALPWKPTGHPGVEIKVLLEDKGHSLALHYRRAPELADEVERLAQDLLALGRQPTGL